MVCVALFLGEVLGEVGAVGFGAVAVGGDVRGRDDAIFGGVVVDAVEGGVGDEVCAVVGGAELGD